MLLVISEDFGVILYFNVDLLLEFLVDAVLHNLLTDLSLTELASHYLFEEHPP